MSKDADLPLRYDTPRAWVEAVLREPLALLNDHAHLEKKAATNALELLNRWPEPNPPENWVTAMAASARARSDGNVPAGWVDPGKVGAGETADSAVAMAIPSAAPARSACTFRQ